ncbi:hypothetical protein Trydic_g16434 [Trypoxylus dichotomus]
MSTFGECSLMKEISKTEDAIKLCRARVSNLENKLREIDNDDLRRELQEVQKLLNTNEDLLHSLHKRNTGSFIFGAVIVLIIFIVWMLYILVNGSDF